jgi:uncharacterized membrane protein HdeD (DUF308 family)
MAVAVHRPHVPHLSQPGDTRHPLEAALAGIGFGLGLVAILTAPAESLHAVTAWLGAAAVVVGATAQMVSATTRERWFCIAAVVMGAVSVLFGLAHGGWV